MAVLIVVGRVHTLHEPLEPDVVTYATIGHEMASGKRLYSDVWDVKPPGLYATYMIAELLAGPGDRQVWFLGTLSALATLLGVYAAGAALGRRAGLLAAAFWTALSGVLVIQANQPNSEVFIDAAWVAAFALLVRQPRGRPAWLRALVVGVLLGLGSTYKPIVVFLAFFLALAHVAAPPAGRSARDALLEVALMGVGAALIWVPIFAYAAASGQSDIYWATNVTLNRQRGGNLLLNLFRYLREGKILPPSLLFLLPGLLLVAAGVVVGLRRGPRREWILFGAAQAGVHLMIFSQGRAFHPHSYQMWLPTLSIGAGWAAATLARDAQRPGLDPGEAWRRHAGWAAAALALVVVLAHEVPNYFQPPEEWARRKYGERVVEDPPFARAVASLMRPNETLFEYGDGAAFYYYGGLRPTTPTLWASHLLARTPLAARLSDVTMARLQAQPPDLFVVDARVLAHPAQPIPEGGLAWHLLSRAADGQRDIDWDKHAIYRWAMANYRPCPQDAHFAAKSTSYALFVRRGSDLDRRLSLN
jgi:hypothetical protein